MTTSHALSAAVSAKVEFQALQVHALLEHAARVHADKRVTSLDATGTVRETSYADLAQQADRISYELRSHGLAAGDAIVNLGFSSAEQLAWLYGALRLGLVTHLLNPLHEAAHLAAIVQSNRFKAVLYDAATQDLARVLPCDAPRWPMVTPASGALLGAQRVEETWPSFVCYTSGTTGVPKSALYTHRSTVLHAWACALPDALGVSRADRVMPLMQTFHASAWGAPFVCPLVGADLLLVPPSRDPAQWYQWIEGQGATILGAVSAHWLALAAYMQAQGLKFTTLRKTIVGGTRLPSAVADFISHGLGVEVRHAWGMTETSPLATIEVHQPARPLLHGRPVFGVECDVSTEADCPLGSGELKVRGHWIAQRAEEPGGWLCSGDRALWNGDGRLQVVDRMVESLRPAQTGGVVVSASEVEHLCRIPGVRDVALVKLADEAPAIALILAEGADPAACIEALERRLAGAYQGWRPRHFVQVREFPYTASAKVKKQQLADLLAREISAGRPAA
ncbi:AMP-binding protein [Pelomonas sp. APW6]|uniref:AMP-binding protein n=1 Tax=Roseateles subflavus TaxID=3053353 RepID=A0ABT7LPB1_9BURK|nr:AMP-binding protein [Pelomonas sp. APW6]MDL5034668.1 AMP-binding protein [Pelomonas sp. APW6]